MVLVTGTGALDEGDLPGRLAIARTGDPTGGDHLLQLDIGDHVGRCCVAEVVKTVRVVRFPASGLDDGANPELTARSVGLQFDVELPGLTADTRDRRLGVDRDVFVLLHLCDEGGQIDSLRIPVGRFVRYTAGEPAHPAAKLRLLLDEHHLTSDSGGVEGRRNSGHSPPDHHEGPVNLLLEGDRDLDLPGLDDTHPEVILGHHLGVFVVRFVTPDHLLPEVHPLGVTSVEGEGVGHEAW